MSRDTPCSERVHSHWEGRLEDFQRFHDAAYENGVFDGNDYDYDDAELSEDGDEDHPWVLLFPDGDTAAFEVEADALKARREYRIEKGLDSETGERPDRESVLQEFYEYGLSFDYVAPYTFKDQDRGYWRYQLSWGGPSDEINFYGHFISDYNCVIYRATYAFKDWFDGAEITLSIKDPIVRFIWDQFNDTGTAGHQYQEAMKDYEPPINEDEEENEDD